MRSSTWGEDKFMSRNQLWRFCLTMKAFKGRVMWEGHQKHLLFSLSVVSSSLRPMEACQAFMPFIFSFRLLRLMSIESMMPSNHLILCHPLFLLSSVFPFPFTRAFSNESALWIRWPNYWSFSFNTLATWCKEPTHWKRPWGWERLKAGGKGGDRGWDGWMASLTQWTWVRVNSGSWWWTGKPGVLQSTGSQIVGHNWATELTIN